MNMSKTYTKYKHCYYIYNTTSITGVIFGTFIIFICLTSIKCENKVKHQWSM